MGNESANRIQTSILNGAERKALVWLAERQPRWVTSDLLTFIGLGGAIICALGFFLSNYNLNWLWLSSGGILINWYGDSLDGSLARVRHTQRPVYGFFIDHNIDSMTISIMCIGAGLSPLIRLDVAMLVLVGYLVISIYTYIGAILKNEFRLTYGKLGPTEFRLIVIIINTLFIYTNWHNLYYNIHGFRFGLFDFIALGIALILFAFHLTAFFKGRKVISREDPLKPWGKEEKE
ncbi:MAG: CDP-alcohol phosphatidyltransferase [Bacteroidales bacterium]|jgi:phosphatidylglycerophosphate synthase|nr:CDP-alcohol phosphatidyltransferase [Bacteroidales bacterium]MCI2145383.1 CDP-alcohol phosphatidyltransferase [Bacteroidales bacterium]